MAFIFEYIQKLNISRMKASEVSQCLLYLTYMSKRNPEIAKNSEEIRNKLTDRLEQLRKAHKSGPAA
jgi:tRNA A22 N-methylase